jgi:hypothetical protein
VDKHDYLARLHTLAHLIERGSEFKFREDIKGWGPEPVLEFTIQIDQAEFWALFTELEPVRRLSREGRRSRARH